MDLFDSLPIEETGLTAEQEIKALREELAEQNISEILALLDVLVDGEFKEEEKSLLLTFRGSANQRLIDVKASLAAGHAVPWTAGEKKPAAK